VTHLSVTPAREKEKKKKKKKKSTDEMSQNVADGSGKLATHK